MMSLYIVTNEVTGNQYIGVTNNMVSRIRSHLCSASRGSKYPLHAAIRKHGTSAFTWRIISKHPDRQSAYTAEISAIATIRPAYNATKGGSGVLGTPRTPEWRRKVSKALSGRTLCPHGLAKAIAMAKNGLNNKPIMCLNDGMVFDSLKSASLHYGVAQNRISTVLSGREISVRGLAFGWRTNEMDDAERERRLSALLERKASTWKRANAGKRKPVVCNETGVWFESSRAAAVQLAIPIASAAVQIAAVARGAQKHVRGYTFRFAEVNQ